VTATSTQRAATTDGAALAAAWGLERVGRRKSFFGYVADSWRRRHFAIELAKSQVIAQSAEHKLGILWELLNPLLLATVYYLAFGVLLGTKKDSSNFLGFLLCGVLSWAFISRSIRSGSSSVTTNRNLVRSLHFPRLILPVAVVLRSTIGFYSNFAVLIAVALITGEGVRWQWAMAPLTLVLMAGFTAGAAMLMARASSIWRDLHNLLPYILRMWMYFAGVFFAVRVRYEGQPELIKVIAFYNPAAVYFEMMRASFLQDESVDGLTLFWGVAWAVIFLIAGTIIFWRGEESYGSA
jgi:teichoic acid transport system permease protein